MQFSVYDIVRKIEFMDRIIEKIENDDPINEYADDIHDILVEYSDIIKCAKVNI